MMHPKNYVAEILKKADKQRIALEGAFKGPIYTLRHLIGTLKDAVHFLLPNNGEVLDGWVSALPEMSGSLHLPYDCVTLEFDWHETGRHKSEIVISALEVKPESADDGSTIVVHAWIKDVGSTTWVPAKHSLFITEKWEDVCAVDEAGSGRTAYVAFKALDVVTNQVVTYDSLGKGVLATYHCACLLLLQFLVATSCSNVSDEVIQTADLRVNARRTKMKKLPLLETRCLVINVPGKKSQQLGSDIGKEHERNGPRQHLRRGHIRHLSDDRRIWVNSCIVGDPSKGSIEKSYAVQGARRAA